MARSFGEETAIVTGSCHCSPIPMTFVRVLSDCQNKGVLIMIAATSRNIPMPAWKAWVAFLLTLSVLALSGCNTTAGFGHDVKNTGAYIQDKANDAKD
jgi:predicted small secreted protein